MPQAQATPQQPPLTDEELKKALEALLFITDHPLGVKQLCKITGVKDEARVVALIGEIKQSFESAGSAVQLLEIAEGYQMATRQAFAPFVRKLFADRMTMKLSTAAHETLSIIAYKQPITRAEIEQIRGVEVIAALETLLEKRLVKVVGRKETVGRPLMYGTTEDFLRHFGLRSLEDLPPIDSFSGETQPPADASAAATPETSSEAWESAAPAESAGAPAAEGTSEEIIRPGADESASSEEAAAQPRAESGTPAEAEVSPEPAPEEPKRKNLWADDEPAESKDEAAE